MKECLIGLVGVSQSDCDCFTDDLSADLKESSFGLYIDDLEGIDMQLIQNAIGCGDNLVENFNKSYNKAVIMFQSDLQVSIAENFQQKYRPYSGRIGEKKYSQPLPVENLVGIKLDTQNIESASIIVKSVDLYFDQAGTITLKLYKNDEFIEDYEIAVNEGKTLYTFPTPLNLPIHEEYQNNDYYFVYEPGLLKPMDNKITCSCQGVEQVRGKFLKPYGVKGATFETLSTNTNYAYGISLNAVISCSIDSIFCSFTVDYSWHVKVAMAIWYKLGVQTIEDLFSSREINFDTFSDREYLYTRKKKFESNYNNLVLWLSENTDIKNSNCFICNSQTKITKGKILI